MAFRTLTRSLGFVRPRNVARYCSLSSSPCIPSYDIHDSSSTSYESHLSERYVLQQLSDLLPIDPKPPFSGGEKPELPRVSDSILSPAEKLRGVFLQNLVGRSTVESVLTSTGVDLTDDIFADVLDKGNLGGAAMVSFFDWALKQSRIPKGVGSYNVVLRALGRRKFFGFVDEILVRLKNCGLKPNLETLRIIIDSFVAARHVNKAVEFFKTLEETGSQCDMESFNILVSSLCRRSHVRVANTMLNTMKGRFPFDNVTYNEIIGGWAKFGRVDKVEILWEAMIADGLCPDCVTYSYLIEALGRAGRTSNAVIVFEKMEERGCLPDTTVYNAMISNFVSAGDLDGCMNYYKRMRGDSRVPDVDTYNRLISAFLNVRKVADALEMFDEMLDRGISPSTGMITSFIEPLCSFGPPHAAMLIYKKSRKLGCRISLKAYKLLLMRLSRFGKCGMVLKIWEEMQDSGYASDKEVYGFIVNGLCNVGQVDTAVVVMEESLKKGFCVSKVVYSKLNNKLIEMNKVETAYKLFLKVKEARGVANSQRFWRDKGWHF